MQVFCGILLEMSTLRNILIRFPTVLAPKHFLSAILGTLNTSTSHWIEDEE